MSLARNYIGAAKSTCAVQPAPGVSPGGGRERAGHDAHHLAALLALHLTEGVVSSPSSKGGEEGAAKQGTDA